MLAHGFVFVSVIGLLVRSSLAIDCYPGTVVDSKECHRALSQIVYENGDVLGTDSKHFGYIYGNCSIIVVNPKGASPSKQQIESGFNQILGKCKPESGGGDLPANEAVFLNIGNRGTGPYAPYESDFPFFKEACGLNTNAPDTKKEDCLKAYNSIPLSAEGQFLSDNHTETIKILKTYQTCTVSRIDFHPTITDLLRANSAEFIWIRTPRLTLRSARQQVHIYASDGSNIVATNGNVRPVFKKMLNQCNGKSGVVSMKKGVQGHNGRLFLKTRSSAPCGIDGENKQVCH
ncbi:hypothetical protein PGTUg99_006830 [Puccinia graminis f. sp. tritici]|uniref:Uncharacterized protein n=1 Tax=Puccinia graminis f. sp. tritici TaxID=56615 RepID=A0A5B0RFL3_PUCGR|nr:hypothetical protein PGTUg99_006830 [Puccinia graminis f. sp. tritici]